MSTTEVTDIEYAALAGLDDEAGNVEADLDAAALAEDVVEEEPEQSPGRLAIAVGCTTIGAAMTRARVASWVMTEAWRC